METFTCPDIELQLCHLRDSMQCVIQSLLFLRSLNPDTFVETEFVRSEILGIQYVRLVDVLLYIGAHS